MKRKQGLWNALTIGALVVAIGVWVALPWFLVLALAALLGLWLGLTRTGRLALQATRIGVASLPSAGARPR